MKAIITYLIFASLTTSQPDLQNTTTPLVKESIFMTMERTPCFGKCPSYKITIFNTGNVRYEGFQFAEKQGKYTKKLSKKQLVEIATQLEIIRLFELKDTYDSKITDIPSCILTFNYEGKRKKILDRDGAPSELRRFEKFIDALVITDDLIKMEK
jgi:hypothetical protein